MGSRTRHQSPDRLRLTRRIARPGHAHDATAVGPDRPETLGWNVQPGTLGRKPQAAAGSARSASRSPPSEREQKQAEILKGLIRNLKELEGQGGDPANGVTINVTNIANNHPQGRGDGRTPYTEETNRAGEGMA